MKETEVFFLAEYLAKVALVLSIAFLILYPLRRQVAAVKHRVWMGLFVAVIALPVVMAFPRWGVIPRLDLASVSSDVTAPAAGAELAVAPLASPTEVPLSVAAQAESGSISWRMVFVAAWMIGALVVVARMGLAWIFLSRIKRQMQPVSEQVQDAASRLLNALGIQRKVSISVSDHVAMPFVWGICSPRVVLPFGYEQWSSAELDMVLRHELSHVKRWDAASLLVSRLFFALNWVNPLAWIASRQAMRLREEACDQMVLAGGHRESDYAALLLSQAKTSNCSLLRSATISMAELGTVERRIRDILGASQDPKRVDGGSQRGVAGLALGAVIAVTLFVGLAGISQAQKTESEKAAEIAAIEAKLDSIIIPKLELNDTPFGDAIAFLRHRSVELDTDKNPNNRGVNFVLKGSDENAEMLITLKLSDVPLRDAIRYIASLAQREYKIEANAVIISAENVGGTGLVSRSNVSITDRDYSAEEKAKIAATEKKLQSLIMPSVEFSDTPLKQALDFIAHRSKALDEADGQGISLVLSGDPEDVESIRISLKLTNAPLGEVLRFTVELAGMAYAVQPNAVLVADREDAGKSADAPSPETPAAKAAKVEIEKKLNSIIVPSIEFIETPLSAALEFLVHRSAELDVATTDPTRKGVNVILSGGGVASDETQISLKLTNVSLADAFRYTAELAGLELRVEAHAVILSPIVKVK